MTLTDAAYARLLALRTGLRHFETWSAKQARAAGLAPAHHQLLLAIRGHGEPEGPTIGDVADYLLLLHHSAVGLVNRAEAAGLVSRTRSEDDHRLVRLRLTEDGAARLEALSALHLEELDRLQLDLPSAWAGLAPAQGPHGFRGPLGETRAAGGGRAAGGRAAGGRTGGGRTGGGRTGRAGIARVYDDPAPGSVRVLVDRLWPRGIAKETAPFDEWCKQVAPSSELRKWYGHDPARFDEFARRYRQELTSASLEKVLDGLRDKARTRRLILVTATRALDRSGAAVLRDVLSGA